MQEALSQVLRVIKPSEDEAEYEEKLAQLLVSHVQNNVPEGCTAVLTGSMAKRTFLRDKKDIDIFVLFDRSVPRVKLEPSIRLVMASAFPTVGYQMSYAEHPYARFHFEGRRVDLVPAYRITDASQRVSAVDRSVLHTGFVLKNLKPAQTGDVLLLKQFLRANSMYGAEIKIAGFSGYLCELLIIYYGGFANLVRAAAKWKAPVYLEPAKRGKTKKQTKKSSERAKAAMKASERFGSLFVVVDPTDANRNVAAAVSEENLKNFISLCKRFVAKPSKQFFFRTPETFEEKAAKAGKGKKLLLLSMPRPEIVDDILWGQLYKMTGQLERHLKDLDFNPKGIMADDSRHLVRLAIILEKDKLPATMLVEGPPLEMKKHVEQFKKSHKKAKFSIKKKQLYATVKRPVTKAEDAIMQFFHEFSKTKSHLAYHEEMLILSRLVP
ncbi:MAG: CCA tRNA nucleotidyltransferase [Candidatus ainarchaeum sp.]|nr:CCA tRNA nucleotidyltransferase [Candidatus ainarchaeum sp.]